MKPNKQFHKRASLLNVVCITLIALAVVPTAWQPTQVKADETSDRQKKPLEVEPGHILFEVCVYTVDQSIWKSRKIEFVDVRVDADYARKLADLAKEDEQVKCESPTSRMLRVDGEEGTIEIQKVWASRHSELNGVRSGVKITLCGTIQSIRRRILLSVETQQYDTLESEKTNVLPVTVSESVKAYIEVANRQPIVISGYADAKDPSKKMIVVITPTFDKKADITKPIRTPAAQEVDSPKKEPEPVAFPVFSMGAVERLQKRTEFIQKDLMVKALTEKIVALELQLLELSLNLAPNHPSGGSKHQLLQIMSERLAERQHEIGRQFDDAVEEENQAETASR